ncbi:MAG: hypothetical protein NC094_01280 [Bacteroidales bacterium]|nr:hypothetical protein [Lachnoclostridium sp.]MCM1384481.1 hypothetical protein [Lachnoclostridium sp.]MCM1464026.1 hypothetical protein [Bacteroidales bacterium]
MSEQEYFKNAMSNFTFEVASGGAIRHLSDLGYTVSQIMKQMTFPTPYERVQKTVWEHFLDTGVVRVEEPGSPKDCGREKVTYVRDYDKYGKPSFRRVVISSKEDLAEPNAVSGEGISAEDSLPWKELCFGEEIGAGRSLSEFLIKKCRENGEEFSYASCDFGLRLLNEDKAEKFIQSLQVLEESHREYILGLLWERRICYHRLDKRMREIVVKLQEIGEYKGTCYFLKTRERVSL